MSLLAVLSRLARWLFWVFLVLILWLWLRRILQPRRSTVSRRTSGAAQLVQDPVCGSYVPIDHAVQVVGPSAETVYFCSRTCAERFVEERRPTRLQKAR